MIRAVVVDVDDTLCLTEAVCFELENEVLARIGRAPMPREVHLRTWGLPLLEHLLAPAHPLAMRLTAAYHADNTRYRKPDPRVFGELLAATGLAPSQCLYVGDSPGDAAAATGAGLRFVACLQSGLRRRTDFATYAVDGYIDAFPEIVDAVTRLTTTSRAKAAQREPRHRG